MSVALAVPSPTRGNFVETRGQILQNGPLPRSSLYWAELEVGPDFPEPVPGQFVMLAPLAARGAGVLLARPFSIARAIRLGEGWRLGFLYARVGRGTELMAHDARGPWRVLGPLGRGFPLDHAGPALLVAGGRGVAPLVFLAEFLEARGRAAEILVGARGRRDWVGPAELGAQLERSRVWQATDDGSLGMPGRVLDLFDREAALERALAAPGAALHVCGPHGLLAAADRLGEARGVPVHASIEAYMACGTGICRTCVVPRPAAGPVPAAGANPEYLIACLEGPVVPASSVDWERDRDMTPLAPASAADDDPGALEGLPS